MVALGGLVLIGVSDVTGGPRSKAGVVGVVIILSNCGLARQTRHDSGFQEVQHCGQCSFRKRFDSRLANAKELASTVKHIEQIALKLGVDTSSLPRYELHVVESEYKMSYDACAPA